MRNQAWVCYCLLRTQEEGEDLREAFGRIQDAFAARNYEDLYQGLAVAREAPSSIPFRKYGEETRFGLDGTKPVRFALENLVLAYAMFQCEADQFQQDEDAEGWLVLLVSGMDREREEIRSLLRRFRALPAGQRIRICWIPERGQGQEEARDLSSQGLVDVSGLSTMLYELGRGEKTISGGGET